MAKQILLLCAVVIGNGADAITRPAGWVGEVDDAIADELVPAYAKFDSSELPVAAKPARTRRAAPSAPAASGGEGGDGSAGDGGTPAGSGNEG